MMILNLVREKWAAALFGLFCIAIVHILATLFPAYFSSNPAYGRLSDGLPVNQFVVLPPARPGVQVLPYQLPDTRYAICRYDARTGPIELRAYLPAVGWTLSIYTPDGTSFYDAPGRPEGTTRVNLLLKPPGGKFLGLRATGKSPQGNLTQMVLPSEQGIIVIRAPLGGIAYAHETDRAIRSASCIHKPFAGS